MKQVVFAVLLMAMASLTGCLNEEDSPVDENIDTTDDSISDTTDDSTSDTTEDNSDTTDDTKEDELIEPVGGNGDITIPEDSSIFIDSMPYGINEMGQWECDGIEEDRVCNYVFYDKDTFPPGGHYEYVDSDGIKNSIDFNGWVNKTGNTVTIEGLKYPDRGPKVSHWQTYTSFDYRIVNEPVSTSCNYPNICEVIFYGHNGLTYSGEFTLSAVSKSWMYSIDVNGDGIWGGVPDENESADEMHSMYEYFHHTVTFNLPFEPYGFSVIGEYGSADRVF